MSKRYYVVLLRHSQTNFENRFMRLYKDRSVLLFVFSSNHIHNSDLHLIHFTGTTQ